MTIAKLTRRFLQLTTLAAFAIALCAVSAVAQRNLIYINGNIPINGQNGVVVLVNDGAGNLSPIAGSPFLTGGTGVGTAATDADFDSDGEIAINPEGTLLYAVNGHSNTIAGFTINSDGTLTKLSGSPYASGGPQPASIAYKDNALGNGQSMMVVVNKDSDPLQTPTAPNYTSLTVSSSGIPTMNPGSAFTLPVGSSPSQAIIRRGAVAGFFGVEFLAGTVSSYKLTRQGIMSVTNSLVIPGPTPDAVSGVLHPTIKALYLTLPHDKHVQVYGYDTTGKLTSLGTALNLGTLVCWAAVNAAGTRLYTSEPASSTITVYDITKSKMPLQLQHLAVIGAGALPTHMQVDPTGQWLYVLDRLGVVHVFDIASDGTVAENHTPFNLGLPSGTTPLGLQVLMK
jgi:hypothetical protein